MRDALKRVKGVGDVIIFGERKYSMRLWLDPVRLASARPYRQRRGQRPARAERPGRRRTGRAGTQRRQTRTSRSACAPSAGSAIPRVRAHRPEDGEPTARSSQLRDVGRAELGAESYAGKLRYNGYEAMGIGVLQLSNANALDVDKACQDRTRAALRQALPAGPEVSGRV